jgi:hypothetical protein
MCKSCGFVGSVPPTAMVYVTSEGGDLSGEFVLRGSWEYKDVVVPVSTERWAANILHISLDMLIRKHLGGREVVFAGYERETVKALLVWMEELGVEFDILWYAEYVDQNGVGIGKVVTFGMFAWAVRCGVISEEDLWEAERSVGSLLALAVSLCHGPGLVDADVLPFVRCVFITFDVSFIVVLYVSDRQCCSLILIVP